MQKHLQEIINTGAIWPSNSPLATAIILVRKKNGKLCFCIDLRKLNSLMVKDAYKLLKLQDTLDCLQGAVWFTLLDLKSGYWQEELEETSKALTALMVGSLAFYQWDQHSSTLWRLVWEICSSDGALFILLMSSFLQPPWKSTWRGSALYCHGSGLPD